MQTEPIGNAKRWFFDELKNFTQVGLGNTNTSGNFSLRAVLTDPLFKPMSVRHDDGVSCQRSFTSSRIFASSE
jgi:hypothetical protein